ncbi:uncharacterized protein [Eleutherodactylus coqui]|uniref:uncharacterized protein n=1 Tax=Eleutherodactylus coqui TaxID=57060 RepID=UPI0034632C3E
MPSCIVKGCTHYTGMKAINPMLTMHVFPRELSRIKLWLQQIGQNFGDIDTFALKVLDASRTGKYRICSVHFAPGSYTSQGSRVVLKHDAIPTLFPGKYPKPPPDRKPNPAQDKKQETTGKRDNTDTPAPKTDTQKKEAGPPANVDCHKRLQEGVRRTQGPKQSQTRGAPREQLLDVNGRYAGPVYKSPGQKETKTKPVELSDNSSLPPAVDSAEENRRALWSLENVMVSLLQHLAEAPLTSRSQKQKTGRLLNQTAEIISVLTGEEWTVVKKNSHISKFYNMIREVPIKCGDVAVFFSMDEWDYIEDHEEHYKHVMVEEPKSLELNGSSDGMKTDFFLETQCEPRPNFGDLDFGEHLDLYQNPVTFPLTDEEELIRKDIEVLDMTCSSDDAIEEQAPDVPQSEKIDSFSGDKDRGDHLDVPRTPMSSPPLKDKPKAKRKKDEVLPGNHSTDVIADLVPDAPARVDASSVPIIDESLESSSSELWIAQDGTTSSTWIPQDDPRPKGRNCSRYGKNAARIQCPVSLSGTMICIPEQPLTRAESLDPHCDLCDLTFSSIYELDLHQITHSKKPRL